MPWGGSKLAAWVRPETVPESPIGEAWLLSDHPLHASLVSAGPLQGVSLRQLLAARSEELLGTKADRFPLLIKLLDARENLSIQVHPDDDDAQAWAPAEGGKTESWLVLEAAPEAVIYLGLKPGIDAAAVAQALKSGDLPACLVQHRPQAGDCYFVPAGTIHALGGGVVVLEVQQTSDATFRLHDWGRLDPEGKPRPLHHEAALAVLKEAPERLGPQPRAALGPESELLIECQHYAKRHHALTAPLRVQAPAIFVGLTGTGLVRHPAGNTQVEPGQAVLLPACLGSAELVPEGQWAVVEVVPRQPVRPAE
jgi:mannose-6-phosphate isomerase